MGSSSCSTGGRAIRRRNSPTLSGSHVFSPSSKSSALMPSRSHSGPMGASA